MTFHVSWVDAFCEEPFAGNAAAICRPGDPPSIPTDEWMQDLAAEFGISETSFLVPTGTLNQFALRWFTPTSEVDLCGHATLAAAHALAEDGMVDTSTPVEFETRSGILTAAYKDDLIELDLPADPVSPSDLPGPLASLPSLAGQAVSSGTSRIFFVVELSDANAVRAFQPDLEAIGQLDQNGLLITAPADQPGIDYVLRFFAPKLGIDEDPVTGSAQCALGPFWADKLGRPELEARQLSARGGALRVRVEGERIKVGGQAVTVMRGTAPGPLS